MAAYERTQIMSAPPDAVFAFLQEPANLPKYLPPIHRAEVDRPEHIELDGEGPDGKGFHNEGHFHVDPEQRRMTWGAELDHAYSGWLEVAQDGGPDRAKVTVHLEFGPRSPHPEMQERTPDDRDPAEEALGQTLEAIRRQVEGDGGEATPDELPPVGA
jgi:uncharacterized protein YndB with AHSA1/START domain